MPGPPKGRPLRSAWDRFNEKWELTPSGCWQWTGNTNNRDYGTFYFRGLMQLAHRASYMLHSGEIPNGLVIDHICNNSTCVNPDHLRATTQRINVRSAVANKSHCVNGHELSGDNVGVRSESGWRFCKTCKRESDRRLREKRRVVA